MQPNPNDLLFDALRQWTSINYPGLAARRISIDFVNEPDPVSLPVPRCPCPPAPQTKTLRPVARHSLDFRSVDWFGDSYTFTPLQAACVKVLWEAWEQGTPDVGVRTVLSGAGSEQGRLDNVFRDGDGETHPAWGRLIAASGRGMYRLVEPS